ncbi:MAG: phytanoyl-CoA dioxygenase family protein [Chloroflexota bacterium]
MDAGSAEIAEIEGEIIDVPKPLSEEQVGSYVDDGFLMVPGIISGAELEEIKADAAKIARGGYDTTAEAIPEQYAQAAVRLKTVPDNLSDEEVQRTILAIHNPHEISPVILKYLKHPMICGILGQISAAHLPYWDGSVKCMQTMLFVKPPGFQGQAWHQDELFIPTRDRSLVGAWIAVDDATIENGCLSIIPGSHRPGYLYPLREHNQPDEFDTGPTCYGFDESAEVPVEVKAGSVVFFNGYVLHRSRKNRSQMYRRVLVSHYMNAASLLPWFYPKQETGLPAYGQADLRCVMLVAGRDPYSWKGTIPTPDGVFVRVRERISQ